ncbi:MAG: hypothetical protein ABSG53_00030 [Thermoguttaceae bacterium]
MKRFLLLALLLCAGCSDRSALSWDTVMKLHDGQTYAQVMEIMGKPDSIVASEESVNVIGSSMSNAKTVVKMKWATWGKKPENTLTYDEWHSGCCVTVAIVDGLVASISVIGIDVPKEYKPPSDPPKATPTP